MKRSCLIALLSIFANVAFVQNASQERVLEDFSLEDLKPKFTGQLEDDMRRNQKKTGKAVLRCAVQG